MSFFPKGNLKIALKSLRVTRWRSLTTALGIVIGIASVVTIVSIGEGIKHQVSGQINKLGQNLILVRPGSLSSGGELDLADALGVLTQPTGAKYLTAADLRLIGSVSGVNAAVPFSIIPGAPAGSIVIGTTYLAPQVLNENLQYGDFFDSSDDGQNVAVLGQDAAFQLFQGEVPLGHAINIDGQQFLIRGEFNQFDAPPLSIDSDLNSAIFIPYSTAANLENNNPPIYEILVAPTKASQVNQVIKSIDAKLLTLHKKNDFTVIKQSQRLAVSNKILNLLTNLVSGIAAISLLVGGIGIMNVMLVSVTERTREIGIRKAVGATNRQILSQFLTEATALSLIGGIAGVIVSLLINLILKMFTHLQPVIDWPVMLLAVGVAVAVGMVFGIAPAIKAARRDPIDALRYQ